MSFREIKLKSDKKQIFEHFSEGAQPPRSSIQGWLKPPRSRRLCRKYLISEMGLKEAIYLKKDGKSAWRAFEDDLVANSPAFGVSNFAKGRGGYYFESRQTSRKYYQEVCPKGKEMPSVAPTFFLDECFIGFHHEAANILLPYTEMFEELNWTLSGKYFFFQV